MNIRYILSILFLYIVSALSIDVLDKDKMYILIGEEIFMVNLTENEITKELISVLPLKSKLIKENSYSIHIPLSVRMDTEIQYSMENLPLKTNKGDLFLFKGKELILFNEFINLNDMNKDYIKIGNVVEAEGILKYSDKNNNIAEEISEGKKKNKQKLKDEKSQKTKNLKEKKSKNSTEYNKKKKKKKSQKMNQQMNQQMIQEMK